MWEVILDALIDTAKMIPVLYLVYLLIEYLTHHNQGKVFSFIKKNRKLGPILGGTLGVIPQCGFSVIMAEQYSKKAITLGTLIAVFIATSDEAIPILLANPSMFLDLLLLLGIKLLAAIIFGFAIDIVLKLFEKHKNMKVVADSIDNLQTEIKENEEHEHHHCDCQHEHHEHNEGEHEHHHGCEKECVHDGCCADNIFLEALKRTVKIVVFLFVAIFVINTIIHYVGMEALKEGLMATSFFQPFLASLVGLIPSCASSVLITELYIEGGITFASCVAGLATGAGIGILVLFKENKKIWQNILITLLLYTLGTSLGLLVSIF